ncbi:helix-turn-helix transcriptional regulator [Paenibacillus sp. SYP-B3998]|uniref:Helix-turn-helix transcriptional regulator n=1 Tax=Paenibacillus sp. SYP-B3998 TaxID=2678564 RepID=A0A6G3ZXZ1_9BACL|nr:helix-turn-helix transcriptional regulator [Paenibacillus sp. SYP-B3998]
MNSFGHLIQSKREELKILQRELCMGICTRSMISRIETEDYFPNLLIVEKLLERLDIHLTDLVQTLCEVDEKQTILGIIFGFMNDRYEENRDAYTIQNWLQKLNGIKTVIKPEHEVIMYSLKAFVEDVNQNFIEAEKSYKKFIELARISKDFPLLISALNRISFMYINIIPNKASEYMEEASNLMERYSIPVDLTISVNLTLSAYKYAMGEYLTAIKYLKDIQSRKRLSPVYRFRSHNLLGKCLHAVGKFSEAELQYKLSTSFLNYHPSFELIYNNNLGDLYADMGKHDEAYKHQNSSLKIALDIKQTYFAEIIQLRLARLHNLTGKHNEALKIGEEVIKSSANHRNLQIAKLIVSEAQFALGILKSDTLILEIIEYFKLQEGIESAGYLREAYKLLARISRHSKEHEELFTSKLLIY